MQVSSTYAKANLPELLKGIENGATVQIIRYHKPIASLVPYMASQETAFLSPDRLPKKARNIMEDGGADRVLSAVSIVEVAIKSGLCKLQITEAELPPHFLIGIQTSNPPVPVTESNSSP